MAPPPPLRPETLLPTALRKSLTYLDMSRCNLFGRLNESVFRAILGGPQPYAPSLSSARLVCLASPLITSTGGCGCVPNPLL